ncbi:MAG: helix-hairpin-helix domain-containing protein [Rikenellaceae bacterium]
MTTPKNNHRQHNKNLSTQERVVRPTSRQIRGYTVLVVISLMVLVITISRHSDTPSVPTASLLEQLDRLYPIDTLSSPQPTSPVIREYKLLSLDLNKASQSDLQRVYGIGEAYSRRIVEYRESLGGFHSIEQLKEVRGIDNQVYTKIFRNFFISDSSYSKININFATQSQLQEHPYISASMARRIVEARKRGGYFNNTRELIDKDILLPGEALRVAPYCCYTAQ